MKKVLQVLEATEGGTRRHLVDLVTHLDPARFAVSVACATRRDPAFLDDVRSFKARGIAVHVLPMRRAVSPLWDLVALIRLLRLMRRGRYDVVHTHSSKAGFLGRLAAKLAGVPRVVHTPHVFPFDMDVNRLARSCYFQAERFAARLTDCLVCVFPSQRRTAETLLEASKIVVVENEIDGPTQTTPSRAGNSVVGMVGRLTLQKGPAYFIEAARLVAARAPQTRFILIGEGPLRAALERQNAAAGLGRQFLMAGAREEAADLLSPLDIVVLPSLWEGLPYVLLDALAAGKAVVATCVGGIPDVVADGVNGLLVPSRDAPALAEAVLKLLENAPLRATMEEQARKTAATRPGLGRMVKKVSAVYEGVEPVNGEQ